MKKSYCYSIKNVDLLRCFSLQVVAYLVVLIYAFGCSSNTPPEDGQTVESNVNDNIALMKIAIRLEALDEYVPQVVDGYEMLYVSGCMFQRRSRIEFQRGDQTVVVVSPAVNYKNRVHVHEINVSNDHANVVMEYAPGGIFCEVFATRSENNWVPDSSKVVMY